MEAVSPSLLPNFVNAGFCREACISHMIRCAFSSFFVVDFVYRYMFIVTVTQMIVKLTAVQIAN